ncbi:response regulator [Paenibacillus lemnae]|uniref:Response regulator n=1 Tax=Paenibacillus lemnae TaxID=1330551 RepID=A0A848MAJ3_PAELE|nr:response regulator [Paenibacillus lemnae]NMO98097.1 response regulator [Paenibacillus lemnae]
MRVLIVDDEKHVRDAIRLLADWEKHGITEVMEAADGEEAVLAIQQTPPQIVLTDMRMPRKDGAELLTWLHASMPEIKVIVISGYDDFDLVRHTIRSGGLDYILKPVVPEALDEALGKAVEAWRKEEDQRLSLTTKLIEMNQMKPLFLDRLLTDLTMIGSGQQGLLKQFGQQLQLPPEIRTCCLAVISDIHFDSELLMKFRSRRALLIFTLINICMELVKDKGTAFRHMDKPGLVVILYWGAPDTFHSILERINEGMYTTLRRQAHFGTAQAEVFPDDLPRSLLNAEQRLLHRNLLQKNGLIHSERCGESGTSRAPRLASYEEKFRMAALSGSPSKYEAAADEWLQEVRQHAWLTPEMLIRWNSEWDWMQQHWAEPGESHEYVPLEDDEINLDFPVILPLDRDGLLSWEDWRFQLTGRLGAASRVLTQSHSRENHIIHDIARYLEHAYSEEVSLQDIASRFFLSREYISRKFKQEFGMTLSDFLGQLRIGKAKMLLLNPSLRIASVAEMVGYQDEKYFSKVFKKLEGQTPNEYRKAQST